jgi:prevent-host-death family protein
MTHDQITGEVVITATEFKAKCLELLDRVKAGTVKKVHITKRGREVGLLTGPEGKGEAPWDPYSMFGAMRGTAVISDGLDIDGPIYDPEVHGVCDPGRGLWDD